MGGGVTASGHTCHAWHTSGEQPRHPRRRSCGRRLAIPGVEHDLTDSKPHTVRTRFELAIQRMMDAWIAAGRLEVSSADVQLAREFLEQAGWKVETTSGARMRIVNREGQTEEMSREDTVMAAIRRLTRK